MEEVKCAWCSERLLRRRSQIKRNKTGLFYCNRECRGFANRLDGGIPESYPEHYGKHNGKNKRRRQCERCQAEMSNLKYCSSECFHLAKKEKTIAAWLDGSAPPKRIGSKKTCAITQWLLAEANYSCTLCGWNKINPHLGYSPLEIDHIDGNWKNMSRENLQVLCPSCHALQPTYRRLNEGNNEMVGDIYFYRRKYEELNNL